MIFHIRIMNKSRTINIYLKTVFDNRLFNGSLRFGLSFIPGIRFGCKHKPVKFDDLVACYQISYVYKDWGAWCQI